MICSSSSINHTTTKPADNSKRYRSSKMELSGVPYRISHEEHPYSYALNIFDDIVDGAEDDDINDDNDTVKTKQRKQILQVKMYKKEQVSRAFSTQQRQRILN